MQLLLLSYLVQSLLGVAMFLEERAATTGVCMAVTWALTLNLTRYTWALRRQHTDAEKLKDIDWFFRWKFSIMFALVLQSACVWITTNHYYIITADTTHKGIWYLQPGESTIEVVALTACWAARLGL